MVIGSNNEKKEMCSNQDQTGKQSLIGRKWVFIKETNIPAELYKWQMNWKQYPIHQDRPIPVTDFSLLGPRSCFEESEQESKQY